MNRKGTTPGINANASLADGERRSGSLRQSLFARAMMGIRIHVASWVIELLVLICAFVAAFIVRYGGRIPADYTGRRALYAIALIVGTYTVSDVLYRTYRIVWRFASIRDVMSLGITVATAVLMVALIELLPFRAYRPIPLSALLIGGTLGYLALGHVKILPRLGASGSWGTRGEPLIVFGAGVAGAALVRQLQSERGGFRPVAFLDDDRRKLGRHILGLPVLGDRNDLLAAMRRTHAHSLAVAVPAAPHDTVRTLTRIGTQAGARVLIVPSVHQVLADRTGRIGLRDVAMEDLVGRREVVVDTHLLREAFQGQRILVTGAAGSIGSELVRQIRALSPESVAMVDNNESGLTDLRDALGSEGPPLSLWLGSVVDQPGMARIFDHVRPNIVLHAAALKHVDLVENQPHEAFRVNVLGTWICAKEAERIGANTFVLISTDKAVDPIGVLGATKRLCELMVLCFEESRTLFTAVRFGNVIGSRGSVLPRFEEQIRRAGPLTVTHPDMRRYFMSVDEAVRLVLQCAAVAKPARVYVLDMGDDLLISEVATRLARLHGLRVPDDIEIVYTGIRPGERLREALVGVHERLSPTAHPQVSEMVALESYSTTRWHETVERLNDAVVSVDGDEYFRELLLASVAATPDLPAVEPRRVARE